MSAGFKFGQTINENRRNGEGGSAAGGGCRRGRGGKGGSVGRGGGKSSTGILLEGKKKDTSELRKGGVFGRKRNCLPQSQKVKRITVQPAGKGTLLCTEETGKILETPLCWKRPPGERLKTLL